MIVIRTHKIAGLIFTGLFLGIFFYSQAQISHGGMPHSFKKSASLSQLDVELLPYLDNDELLENEVVPSKEEGFIFGKEITVDYNLENSGLWETLPNGDKLWRLAIQSTGAYSLNLIFDNFYIPPHSNFFIYTEDRSYIMGSFTEENNNQWGNFATSLLPGDAIILEYYQAAKDIGKGIIQLSTVVHGYKDFFFHKGYYGNAQGKCHNDINCSLGDDYPNARRAVALILKGKSAHCSGTLLNNTAQDGKPYFLTANHCLVGVNPSTFVFVFEYESTECNSKTEKKNYSINGATLLASYEHSDFALLLLNNKPTKDFNAYYAGWDRRNISVAGTVGIHHPYGDLKKISKNHKLLESTRYHDSTDKPNYPDNTHWEITTWDMGSTEGGSSGSALFNPLEQVIGQLEGGSASCSGSSPNRGSDLYGKFSYSWANGNNPNTKHRLNHWLDPLGTNADVLKGYDPFESKSTANITDLQAISTKIKLSPNPASDKVKIESDIQINLYKIYSLSGQLIKYSDVNSTTIELNINDLTPGVFILEIATEKGITHKKLFVHQR